MEITPDIVKEMLKGARSLADWARALGRSEASIVAELFNLSQDANNARYAAQANQALKVIQSVRTVAPAVEATEAVAVSLGVRIAIGTSLVLGLLLLAYLAYRYYSAEKPSDTPTAQNSPANLGDNPTTGSTHGSGPLKGIVGTDDKPFAPSTPAEIDALRKNAKRQLITVPDGLGNIESIKGATYTGVSTGIVTPDQQAALDAWSKRIDDAVDDLYHEGAFDGFTDTWVNLLMWKPYPAVVKAELKHDGRTVTGFLWINKGDDPKNKGNFLTVKLPITRGVTSGSRGNEELELELADGQIRGTLYLLQRGETLEGELNGSYVSLNGSRLDKARNVLQQKYPPPK